ncbi:ammonium transporter [Cellulomonas sp. WB94]|uniref:ammonium transporter n=1 Tax=Cellulomonas sp. WB94 TaxID=2173174 RepID=UPI000D569AB3|nr:ammonium transporter [Cellulomonas sp. WB94]PVU81877.1 ammonium transporter [Cellulomonas sp. WB94]
MDFVLDTGNTAWMLTSAALVLLMTPGLAFFYGGMVRGKSVLNMMMMSFGAMGVVGIIYIFWGYSMSFGSDVLGWFGNPFEAFGLGNVTDTDASNLLAANGVPILVWIAFQATFAIITVALISGSIADRTKFGTWLVFSGIWVTVSYFPLAHMVWGGGFLSNSANGLSAKIFGTTDGIASVAPIDFAGGTVVHINAGIAAFVLAVLLGKRKGFGTEPLRPHNIPFVMLGAALLWFGWFGFNAGSAGAANATAGLAWMNTTVATCAAMLAWLLTEKIRDGHATSLGAASGVVAGLVAITPAAGALSPVGSVVMGLVAGVLCALAVGLKYKFGYDDSLDVVGVHLVGGLTGTVLIGFLSTTTGLFYGGGIKQLVVQIIIALVAVVYSGLVTLVIGLILKATLGWRVSEEAEVGGVDLAVHGETAYESLGARILTEVK